MWFQVGQVKARVCNGTFLFTYPICLASVITCCFFILRRLNTKEQGKLVWRSCLVHTIRLTSDWIIQLFKRSRTLNGYMSTNKFYRIRLGKNVLHSVNPVTCSWWAHTSRTSVQGKTGQMYIRCDKSHPFKFQPQKDSPGLALCC